MWQKQHLNLVLQCVIFAYIFSLVASIAFDDFDTTGKCPKSTKIIYPCICINGSVNGVTIKCQHVNLATLSIAFQNLAVLNVTVEHLHIEHGQFVRLYGPLFSKVKAKYLTIVDTPIHTLEDYALFGINNTLEQLHMIGTNLSTISPLSFGILGKLTQLNVDGHGFQTLDKKLFVDQEITKGLETLRIVNGLLANVPIETFQPLHKLKVLDLHGNALANLNRNQFKNLRNIEVLDLSFNNIPKFDAHHISDLTKLGWCNVSHNALKELSRGTFARNAVLKVLNLSFNNITSLDVSSFRGMRFLRRLYMSDNHISDIGRGTFGSVAKIGTIDLARNRLKKVEFQMFSQLNYVEIIDLAENNISIVEKNAFKDIYQASINISHNVLEKIEAKAFINCVNITKLDLSHNRLANIKNAYDETTFATEYQLSYNLLNNLTQVPIQNMTGLKIFNVSHNEITDIPKNYFPKLYELHTIDMSYNNLSKIFNGVFKNLFSLRFLDLSHNIMTELPAPVFGPLPTLLEMDLSWNQLSNIGRSALVKLTSLRILHLNHNSLNKLFQIPISLNELYVKNNDLHEVNKDAWPVMNSLISLDLSHNFLRDSLVSDSFNSLLVLQKLYLSNNQIQEPPLDCLKGLTSLQYLHLQNNSIRNLGKSAFGKLPVLFELNLHGNSLKSIDKHAFEGLLQLLTLNMSNNDLHEIPTDAFAGLPSLRTLDLSYNALLKLDNKSNGVLDDLLSLESLNLSHNNFNFVTKKTFPSNQYIPYNLRNLDMSYNKLAVMTYDFAFGTHKLKTLRLDHNQITDIRKGVLNNFTSLEELDLSYNDLNDLKSDEFAFELPPNLTKINLSNNRLYRLPFENLNKKPIIELMDLRNNSFREAPIEFAWMLKNGTKILLQSNPLICNCAFRPIKHFILQQNVIGAELQNITCSAPSELLGKSLIEIADESLECNSEDRTLYKGEIFEELPDVRFRSLQVLAGKLEINWYVSSTEDVADFSIIVRNDQNKVVHRHVSAYFERSYRVPVSKLNSQSHELSSAEVCIVARDSDFNTKRWYGSQCKRIEIMKNTRKSIFFRTNSPRSSLAPYQGQYSALVNLFYIIVVCFYLQ